MRVSLTTAAAVSAMLVLGATAPTAARPLEREHYAGTDSYTFEDCGVPIHNEIEYSGLFMLKAPREAGAPPRVLDNYEVHETLTANGRTLHIDHQGIAKDRSATRVGGTVFELVAMEAGQPFVVRDEAGTVLVRDRGLLVTTFRVDTQGDSDLDNDVYVEGSFEVLGDHGSHPAFYGLVDCDWLTAYFAG